ncbi:Hypothetical protein R9X50_00178200 [Acrodontium crateriforme]|uniref:2,5-diamino-6-ribosylamino-4(3H)-pyrimidinone 5'-phosphate reductase n=1 Tax=Acrodontium crateriforme TaxID=150365 RepID=A0AAQ3R844_9PEZI|nr:Hypothetical protein R9X50_00178200 [Acrodontium crateriforme]
MSEVSELSNAERDFLRPYLPTKTVPVAPQPDDGRTTNDHSPNNDGDTGGGSSVGKSGPTKATNLPFVTLTYASSLDSMISLAPGLRTALSGPETKSMTHYLRLQHDAILIGVGTAIPDNPGLNSRYPGASLATQPRPIIVDPQMRWNVYGSKLAQLAIEKQGKGPWLIHTLRSLPRSDNMNEWGGERLLLPADDVNDDHTEKERLKWSTILEALKAKGINSVMIEGGANIISSLLGMPELVDSVVITIAPTWLGVGGVTVSPEAKTSGGERINAAHLQETSWRQFGQDAVLCGRLSAS